MWKCSVVAVVVPKVVFTSAESPILHLFFSLNFKLFFATKKKFELFSALILINLWTIFPHTQKPRTRKFTLEWECLSEFMKIPILLFFLTYVAESNLITNCSPYCSHSRNLMKFQESWTLTKNFHFLSFTLL